MHKSAEITFLFGAILLFLLFYYMGSTVHRTKKLMGTLLTFVMTGFCLWAYLGLGIKKGIDLGGGSEFTVQLKPSLDDKGVPEKITSSDVQLAIGILEKRLNPNGSKDLTMAPQGDDRIMIQMPGVTPEEVENVRLKIQQVAHLEFRLVHPNSSGELAQMRANGTPVINYIEMPGKEHKSDVGYPASYLVKSRPDLDGKYIKTAYPYLDPQEGWGISLTFTSEGTKLFAKLTTEHVKERLAVVVDNEVLSAPTLQTEILNGSAKITGNFKEEDARALATALENPLKNPMAIIGETSVSAAFGEETIKQGLLTGVVASAIVAIFMAIYYRLAGLIALIGLAVNILMIFGAMAIFNFTLTMPGIAGIVLTVGMAVDANVLIYERLREEMNAGKTLAAALELAFDKAFSAIFDVHVTTMISAVILFYLASGLVKGFAITLAVGVVGTLFGALIVTRICFNWFIDSGTLKRITVTHLIPEGIFDMMSKAKPFIITSVSLTVISLITFVVKGKDGVGIDFRGGAITRFHIPEKETVSTEEIEKALKEGHIVGTYVQQSSNSAGKLLTVRGEYDDRANVKSLLESKFPGQLTGGSSEGVGSIIGSELAVRSSIAYLVAMACIFIYLVVFYELPFAIAAIIALLHDCIIAIGLSVLMGQQLSVIHIGALLTIAGYSVNDTIIVFDRIREMIRTRTGNMRDIMNEAISMTLSRTLLTSLTVLLSMAVLYMFGGPAMQEFSLPIIIGVIIGTYSSIYIASPLVLWYARYSGKSLRRQVLDNAQSEIKPAVPRVS